MWKSSTNLWRSCTIHFKGFCGFLTIQNQIIKSSFIISKEKRPRGNMTKASLFHTFCATILVTRFCPRVAAASSLFFYSIILQGSQSCNFKDFTEEEMWSTATLCTKWKYRINRISVLVFRHASKDYGKNQNDLSWKCTQLEDIRENRRIQTIFSINRTSFGRVRHVKEDVDVEDPLRTLLFKGSFSAIFQS